MIVCDYFENMTSRRESYAAAGVQMLMGHCFVVMLVIVAVLTMNMDMRMGVRMLMGMDSISMAVFVGMRVIMLMGVL